jgi:hypothetical protein
MFIIRMIPEFLFKKLKFDSPKEPTKQSTSIPQQDLASFRKNKSTLNLSVDSRTGGGGTPICKEYCVERSCVAKLNW